MDKSDNTPLSWGKLAAIGSVLFCVMHSQAATVEFKALIQQDVTGCEILLPESSLSFLPLQAKDLTGGITTYQIKPLLVALQCDGTIPSVMPSLTLQGNTPYAQTKGTVFLDGNPNGVGFMVRQNISGEPPLADFYNTDLAIANQGVPLVLTTLDGSNEYYQEEAFWVGVVGPMGLPIIAGDFYAALTLNVSFQ